MRFDARSRVLGSPLNSTVANWLQRGFLRGITPISIALGGAASAAQTLSPAVVPANCLLFYNGNVNAEADTPSTAFTYLTLTNSTTVTGVRNTGASALTVLGTLLELKSGILRSVQRGTTTFGAATTATQAITAVTTTKAILNILGQTSPTDPFSGTNGIVNGVISSSTLLTFTRGGSSGAIVVSWEVVEFY